MEKKEYPELSETLWQTTLPNGLPIRVLPRPGFTKKIAYMIVDFGAIHRKFTLNGEKMEVPAGIAHYLEHKLFDMPGGTDVMAEFARLGANPNAFTGYDTTAYYFSCTENFESCLRLLLEYVSTPYFTEETVQKEQGIIGQEIDMHADNADSRSFEELMKNMYRNHPVTVPILGDRTSIAQITPQLLTACHRAFYRPGNMILCVVGDVDPEQVVKIAREVLPETDTEQVTREERWQEEMTCPADYSEHTMEVSMPMFQLGFKSEAPDRGEAAVRSEIVGDLAAEALFGESSALYLRLYEEGIIDSSFGGGFDTMDGLGVLIAGGDSEDPEAVRAAVLEEAKRLCLEGIPEEDFLRMKRSLLGRRISGLDNMDSTIFRIGAYALSDFDYFEFSRVCRSVERQDIYEFLHRVVTRSRCSLCVINPKEETQ